MTQQDTPLSTASGARWPKNPKLCLQHPWQVFALFIGLLTLQFSALPSLTSYISLEIMPAWTIFLCVTRKPHSALLWTLLCSFFIETHTSSPRGLYILTLMALASITLALRDHISWKYIFPWTIVLLCGYLWFFLAEAITISVLSGSSYETLWLGLTSWLSRLCGGLVFGIILARDTIYRGGDTLEYR